MIKEERGFGSTIEEAKEAALQKLGAPADADIQVDIITLPKKKALGLFGGKQAEVKVSFELPDRPAKRKQNNKQRQDKKPQNQKKPENKPSQKKESSGAPVESVQMPVGVDADTLDPNSRAAKAVAYIRTVLAALKCGEVKITVAEQENNAFVSLEGDDLGVVIGRRGETLDALQYLAGLAANNGGGYYKVTLNIGDYREKREVALKALAKKVSEQVIRTGRSRSLEPMNPYERRIIHTAVQEIDGVISGSFGEGANRRVVIAPEGQELRPPRNDSRGNGRGNDRRRGGSARSGGTVTAPANREPKKDSDLPLYGKIN